MLKLPTEVPREPFPDACLRADSGRSGGSTSPPYLLRCSERDIRLEARSAMLSITPVPQVGDILIRNSSADMFLLTDVVTGKHIAGPFKGCMLAAAAARIRGARAIWQQNVDDGWSSDGLFVQTARSARPIGRSAGRRVDLRLFGSRTERALIASLSQWQEAWIVFCSACRPACACIQNKLRKPLSTAFLRVAMASASRPSSTSTPARSTWRFAVSAAGFCMIACARGCALDAKCTPTRSRPQKTLAVRFDLQALL